MAASNNNKIAVSFTGGKDSVLALHLIAFSAKITRQTTTDQHLFVKGNDSSGALASPTAGATAVSAAATPIALLVTFAPAGSSNGQDFKAHPIPIIKEQAQALQIPHIICEIDPSNTFDSYRQQIKQLHERHGITQLVTGDILDIADGFMAKATISTGVQLVTPLWQLPREVVLQAVFQLGINSVISCVNLSKYRRKNQKVQQPHGDQSAVDQQAGSVQDSLLQMKAADSGSQAQAMVWTTAQKLLGQQITPSLLSGPLSEAEQLFCADKCGEYGEYHTIVLDAPLFARPVGWQAQKVVTSGVYAYIEWECSIV